MRVTMGKQGTTPAAAAAAATPPWCRPRMKRPEGCCIRLKTPPERPDPAIYSQEEVMAAGGVPTWNSPDITTNLDIPWTLLPETRVVVRNLSGVASAVNALVHVLTSPFGIGTPRAPLSAQSVTLGPNQEMTLAFPLGAALLAGEQSLGMHVVLEHPHDRVRINNRGSQVVKGVMTSDVGRDPGLSFPVVNPSGAARTISLSALPNALGATVSPLVHPFAPWEQITATLTLHVPAGEHGTPAAPVRHEATVVARASDGELVGGLTWILWVDT